MEIEVKFRASGRDDLIRALDVLRSLGYDFSFKGKLRYTDTYYETGDGGALRFREYEDGRVIRTYKRDKEVKGGVIYRLEKESESSKEEFEREVKGKTPTLQTLTVRESFKTGDIDLTYDVVWYGDSFQMAFLEVEGPEEDVKKIAKALKDSGFELETRSKLEIGLALRKPHSLGS